MKRDDGIPWCSEMARGVACGGCHYCLLRRYGASYWHEGLPPAPVEIEPATPAPRARERRRTR